MLNVLSNKMNRDIFSHPQKIQRTEQKDDNIVKLNDDYIIRWKCPGIKPYRYIPLTVSDGYTPLKLIDIAINNIVGNINSRSYDLQSLFIIYDMIIRSTNLYQFRLPILRVISKDFTIEEILSSPHFTFENPICYQDILFYYIIWNEPKLKTLALIVEFCYNMRIKLEDDIESWITKSSSESILEWTLNVKDHEYTRVRELCLHFLCDE
jgi:hypothetical protein